MEILDKKLILNHTDSYNLRSNSGFWKTFSCEIALQTLLGVSVLYLNRTFEIANREILLQIIYRMGFAEVLSWFKSYIESRLQITKFHDVVSNILTKHGITQNHYYAFYTLMISIMF